MIGDFDESGRPQPVPLRVQVSRQSAKGLGVDAKMVAAHPMEREHSPTTAGRRRFGVADELLCPGTLGGEAHQRMQVCYLRIVGSLTAGPGRTEPFSYDGYIRLTVRAGTDKGLVTGVTEGAGVPPLGMDFVEGSLCRIDRLGNVRQADLLQAEFGVEAVVAGTGVLRRVIAQLMAVQSDLVLALGIGIPVASVRIQVEGAGQTIVIETWNRLLQLAAGAVIEGETDGGLAAVRPDVGGHLQILLLSTEGKRNVNLATLEHS